jgi:cyclopropane fatty-acyl-phospholipid synthase-like methyltransferase
VVRSNLACWKELQAAGYFEKHPLYQGGSLDMGEYDVDKIERFVALAPHHTIVVIGCGYGREAAHFCRRVAVVYGIDVSLQILDKAAAHVRDAHGMAKFRPVLAERYATDVPIGIDIVYSVAVMQHLTRDMVCDYLQTLGGKLSPDGRMVIQFLETDASDDDAAVARVYEPSVSWSACQIAVVCQAAGLTALDIKTDVIRPGCAWHWAFVGRA